jgi:hypothetical protein
MAGGQGDRFLQVRLSGEDVPEVPEDRNVSAGDNHTLQSPDVEQLRSEECYVLIIGVNSVVRPPREGVRATHLAAGYVVEGEIEAGEVEGPPCLSPVEVLGLPEVL